MCVCVCGGECAKFSTQHRVLVEFSVHLKSNTKCLNMPFKYPCMRFETILI